MQKIEPRISGFHRDYQDEDYSKYEEPKKLFVYGIFLGIDMRHRYGMLDPTYATVKDYATFGDYIVKAYKVPGMGLALTGVLVTPDQDRWESLDRLESGYDRVIVTTTSGIKAWMYVNPEGDKND